MVYKPQYFGVEELVHPLVVDVYGKDRAWQFLDYKMLQVIDELRYHLGACTINDWAWGGSFYNSGLRVNWGSGGSAHRFGCAFDLKFIKTTPKEAHEYIRENQSTLFELGLRRVESVDHTPTWVHVDGKVDIGTPYGKIKTFLP